MIHFTRVLVPKNSGLNERAIEALKFVEVKDFKKGIRVLPFRGEDIPALVEEFNARDLNAIGITGEDLFVEYCLGKQSDLSVIRKVPWVDERFVFKKPALCLLGPEGFSFEKNAKKLVCAVNRKYRFLSENFLEKLRRNGFEVEVKEAGGNLEQAVEQGLADICIEVVCTGSTMKQSSLKVVEKVFESDLVLIGKGKEEYFGLRALRKKLCERAAGKDEKSYTCKLLGNEEMLLGKIEEEALELIEAAAGGKKSKIVWESADLLYFVSVLLVAKGVPVEAVFNELRRRNNERKNKA